MKFKEIIKEYLNKIHLIFIDFTTKNINGNEKKIIDESLKIIKKIKKYNYIVNEENEWGNNLSKLHIHFKNNDMRNFLKWKVIKDTMFVRNEKYIIKELNALKKNSQWENIYSKAIKEDKIGNPDLLPYCPNSSSNLIHHIFHTLKYKTMTGNDLEEFDFIFEFGGGYGSMCRLIYNFGFSGKYIIYDLPEMNLLQNYFLKSLNIPIIDWDDFLKVDKGVCLINYSNDLSRIVELIKNRSLFIACWSISETPLDIRLKFNDLMEKFDSFLFAYQDCFDQIDNNKYFSELTSLLDHVNWKFEKIDHLPNNNYLMA